MNDLFEKGRRAGSSRCLRQGRDGPPRDRDPRRARAQPQERRRRDPARPAGGVHRPVRLRQILARLRHHLRRGPAPLRRVAVGLRPAVPGDDAEAGRRPDRRPVAGHLDRAEDHLEEPALDGRHRHRDLRLHAAAVGARRRALFARHRPADREPDRVADGRPRAGAARGHAHLSCWRRWCAAARASTARSSPSSSRRATSASRSTASSTRSPRCQPLDKKFTHDIDVVVDRLVVRPDIAHAARGFARAVPQARRGPGGGRARRQHRDAGAKANKRPQRERRAADLLGEIRLPGVRLHHLRDRAAAVLVQQPVRRLPGLRRPRRRAAHRRRPGDPRQGRDLAQGRDRAVGEVVVALLRADARRARQALQVHPRHQVEGPAEEDPGRDPLRLRRRRHQVHLRRRHARLPDQEAVRGRHHQPRAPLQGDRERLGARGAAEVLHRHPLRGLQRLPAQARGAVRQDRRQAHRRGRRACRSSAPANGSPSCRSSSPPSRTRSPSAC